jgi:hypothetical protein
MNSNSLITTGELAERHGIHPKRMFAMLVERGYVSSDGDDWLLSQSGRLLGGVYKEHPKYGTYIAWPDSLVFNDAPS